MDAISGEQRYRGSGEAEIKHSLPISGRGESQEGNTQVLKIGQLCYFTPLAKIIYTHLGAIPTDGEGGGDYAYMSIPHPV